LTDTKRPELRRGFLQLAYADAETKRKVLVPLLKKYARRNRLLSERKLDEAGTTDAFYRIVLRHGLAHRQSWKPRPPSALCNGFPRRKKTTPPINRITG
jgi:hypothetical protein